MRAGLIFIVVSTWAVGAPPRVIIVSIDGLRPDAITQASAKELPHLYRVRREGAITDNARTDPSATLTVPNHLGMVTGRLAAGKHGHGIYFNRDNGKTLEYERGRPIYSIFNTAHEAGYTTALYVGKSKFFFIRRSWHKKIDRFEYSRSGGVLLDSFTADAVQAPPTLALLHLRHPDRSGHKYGWMTARYHRAVRRSDELLGQLLNVIETSTNYKQNTTLIITSDHGGYRRNHRSKGRVENYVIPFYVWGPKVKKGADLYKLNRRTRQDPGRARHGHKLPPIRNADAANLALEMLGLPQVRGSQVNWKQNLYIK